jgi:hypothetical protein
MDTPAQQAYRPAGASASVKRLWWGVFISAGVLYLLTSQRGPAWQDSGIFQWRMHALDLTGQMGLALAHPLLIVLGRLAGMIPLGPEVWRLNALSSVAGAVAAANLAALTRRLAPRPPAAAYFAAGAFVLCHTVWWLATIAESHALLAALMSGELLALVALVRRPRASMVVLLGVLNGLALSAHNLALLALPAYGLVVVGLAVRRKLRPWAIALFVLSWAAGASLLLALVVRQAGQTNLAGAIHSALFGQRWQKDVLGGSGRAVALGLGYVLYNLPNLALPLAAVGLWRLRRLAPAPLPAAIAYVLAAHFLFAVRYTVPDQFMFFVPFYLIVSLLAGLGLASPSAGGEPRRVSLRRGPLGRSWLKVVALASLALGPIACATSPLAVRALKLRLPGGDRELPFRDNARYWLTPWKHNEDSAGRFAREAIGQCRAEPAPAVIFADGTSYWPLRWVLQVEAPAANVRLVGGPETALLEEIRADPEAFWRRARREKLALFVVSKEPRYCPEMLLPHVRPARTGLLYRLIPPAG